MSNFVARKRAVSCEPQAAPSLYAIDGGRKYLNEGERKRSLDAMKRLDPRKALFAYMLAWSGGRISEILALTASSFQLDRNIVAIITLKRRRHVVREVPIPPHLMAAIEAEFQLGEMQRDPAQAYFLLWPWHRSTGWRIIKEVMAEAGIIGAAACPKGFRHGFGIATLQGSVPLNLVQRWMGHARLSTTAIYADASGPEEQAFAARFWGCQDGDGGG